MTIPLILGWNMPLALANGIKWPGDTPHIGWTFKCTSIIWFSSFVLSSIVRTAHTKQELSGQLGHAAKPSKAWSQPTSSWHEEKFLVFINLSNIEVICYHSNKWPIIQASNILPANWFDFFPLDDVHPCFLRPWSTWYYPISLLLDFNFQCFMPWL